MLITCPGCKKKLNVSETITRKNVRCPGCKTVTTLPDRQAIAAASRQREAGEEVSAEPPQTSGAVVVTPTTWTMRCAKCKVAALRQLPANPFSRNPGFVCTACGARMRPAGSSVLYIFAVVLGACVVLMGLVAVVAALTADAAQQFVGRALAGAVVMVLLGGTVAGWAGWQLFLPVPLDAPKRPSRVLFSLAVIGGVAFVALLVIGGCLFGVFYYIHEMM
jgi:hypothetical protein